MLPRGRNTSTLAQVFGLLALAVPQPRSKRRGWAADRTDRGEIRLGGQTSKQFIEAAGLDQQEPAFLLQRGARGDMGSVWRRGAR